MKIIPLSKNDFAIVDDVDYIELSRHKWYVNTNGYAIRDTFVKGKKVHFLMHRIIMNAPDGVFVDHINGNRRDNRRKNLRLCSMKENNRNSVVRSNNKSRYKGVSFHRQSGLYHACITIGGKHISLRYHKTPEKAARAYDKAAKKHFGEFAKLNNV